ncbi:hypothetical protein MJM59_32500, partial [Salmonella enterica subsp. enterica serovar Montevideo]|nr:hypothetical protein [Salmonella enterica subsp. enterica serovar Montevideo]
TAVVLMILGPTIWVQILGHEKAIFPYEYPALFSISVAFLGICEKHARELAELAVSETGMGRVDDKFAKNVAQARGTPGVECLSP